MEPDVTDEALETLLALRDRGGRRWRCGVAKFFIDGVIDTGTAWLWEPGPHGEGTEPFWPDPDRYAEVVARCARGGFQCATHAIGDRAIAARSTPTATPGRAAPARTASSTWRRCATRSCAGWRPRAWPRRCSRCTRWGSTSPARTRGATTCSPRRSRTASAGPTSAAAARSSRSAPTGPWSAPTRVPGSPGRSCAASPGTRTGRRSPDQALTAIEALEGYTTEAARVIGEEHLSGRIAPGLRADLTGLGADPVDCPPDELPDVPVALTSSTARSSTAPVPDLRF